MSRRRIRATRPARKLKPRRVRIEGVDVLVQPGVSDAVLCDEVRRWKAEDAANRARAAAEETERRAKIAEAVEHLSPAIAIGPEVGSLPAEPQETNDDPRP